MKAIILAAGKGTRLEPLTLEVPKAMVQVHGKSLLQHNMDKLLPYVDEFIIVVKYKGEVIREYFGEEYKGIKVTYHEQGKEKGTGAAIKGIITSGELIIAYADAIISGEDVANVMSQEDNAVLVKEVLNPEKYGIFESDKEGYALQVIEKPQEYVGNLANFSFFKVNDSILKYVHQIELSSRGEIEITDAINLFVKEHKLKLIHLKHDIIDITSMEDLEKANMFIKPKLGSTQYLENIGTYEVHIGIHQSHIGDILQNSQDRSDTALQENTSDFKRFGNVENLTRWYNNVGRYVFTLIGENNQISGLVFYRPSKAPILLEKKEIQACKDIENKNSHMSTGGIRLYPNARGKRLATPLLEVSERLYRSVFPNTIICVDIEEENIPSQKTFERAGYIFIGLGENQKTVNNNTHQRYVYIKKV